MTGRPLNSFGKAVSTNLTQYFFYVIIKLRTQEMAQEVADTVRKV